MVILVSLPTAFLFNLYGTLLCAFGRANVALMELVTAVTINIALDYCFVAKLRWRHRGRGVGDCRFTGNLDGGVHSVSATQRVGVAFPP